MRIARGNGHKNPPGKALLRRWPFLVACLLLGTLLAGIVLLVRAPVYEVLAEVHFDPQRYTFATTPSGQKALFDRANGLLALQAGENLRTALRIGQPAEFRAGDQLGVVLAVGRSTSSQQAMRIATDAGSALSEALRTIQGWDWMGSLLRRAIYLDGVGRPESPTVLQPHLYAMAAAGFPLAYDLSIPIAESPPALDAQDVADITLAVEREENRLSAQITALGTQLQRATDPDKKESLRQEVDRLVSNRETLRRTLITLYRRGDELVQDPTPPALPQVLLPTAPPTEPATVPRWPFLLVGALGTLALGGGLSLVDESLGLGARLRELVTYRDMIWNLVLRDLKARYKNSILGYLWSLVNPLLMMGVFTLVFHFLMKSTIPAFSVYIIVGLLPWNYFASSISGSIVSVTGQSNLVKKVYFPREVLPIALVIANLINYVLALPAMFLIMIVLKAQFNWVMLLFPLIALVETFFILGLAFFLSCLNVFFRDTQVVMEVLLTAWFFLTPVFYRLSDLVPDQARYVRWLNPMASLIDFYRDIFYLGGLPGWDAIVRTLVTALAVLVAGYLFFVRFSSRFGEEV